MSPENAAALAAIYESNFPVVRRSAHKVLRDHAAAEDTAQQAFVKLGEAMERRFVPEPEALLRVITKGLVVDAIRSAQNAPPIFPIRDENDDPGLGVREAYLPAQHASLPGNFDRAVRALPEMHRQAFILIELRGLSTVDAADLLGVPQQTASYWADAARKAIRKELQ